MALISLLALLAGCPYRDDSTRADAQRLSVLEAEPLAARDGKRTAVAGWQKTTKRPAVRGHVYATVAAEDTPEPVAVARRKTAEALSTLRGDGWSVYYAVCVPPRTSSATSAPSQPHPIVPTAVREGWIFAAYGYKVSDGVSYFAALLGTGMTNRGHARVDLRLIAPFSGEPRSDLFVDRPPSIPAGASCIEQQSLPDRLTQLGTPTTMDEDGPDPRGVPKLDGHR